MLRVKGAICICVSMLFPVFEFKQNVLFIVVDDLRPALGCYEDGMAYTPNIDRLAERSVIFKNAYAQLALCTPSRNSFLTSRRPDTLHLYDSYSYWRTSAGNFTTLPQYFKENGYHTKAIGKVFPPGISSNHSDDQPYSWSEEPYHPPTQQFKNARVCHQPDGSIKQAIVCPVEVELQPGQSLPDLQSLQEAVKFLNTWPSASSKSFFLAVGFHKPHIPLKYPRKYRDLHPLKSIDLPPAHVRPFAMPTVAWNPWTDLREREDIAALNVSFPFGPMPDDYAKLIIQSYYAAVSYIDDLMGQLLTTLERRQLSNNTIIVLIGDHGWSMAEHGEWAKYSNFDIALRVPFILHVPGLTNVGKTYNAAFASTDVLVELVDLLPSLADLAGLSKVPLCPQNSTHILLCTEGTSIAPLLQDMANKIRTIPSESFEQIWKTGVFSQYPRPGIFPTWTPNSDQPRLKQIKVMGYSLRTDFFRYTEWVPFDRVTLQPDWTHIIARELYNHQVDPDENMNLADRSIMSDVMEALSKQLRAGWRHSLPKMFSSKG